MNKFIGVGNLCRDVELKSTPSGRTFVENAIAIKNDFKNALGEYESEFVKIIVWGKTAEYMAEYACKGMKIAIDGRLQTRNYDDKDGKKVYVTEVICNSVELLERKHQSSTPDSEENNKEEIDPYTAFGDLIEEEQGGNINIDDLEMPFE